MSICIGRSSLALLLLLSLAVSPALAKDSATDAKVAAAIKVLGTGDDTAKEEAAELLSTLGPDAAAAVPALTAALTSEAPMVRAHAAIALGRIGAAAKSAGPALVNLVADKDGNVRRAALLSLRAIKPGPAVTLPVFAKVLKEADPETRMHILHAIASAGEDAVPGLIVALQHPEIKYWAILVLGDLGPKAKAAVPQLTALLKDESIQVRREAAMALGAIGKDAAPAVPAIIGKLNDKEMAVRFAAAYALGILGPDAKAAVPALTTALQGDNEFLRVQAAWALAKINDKDPAAMDKAVEVLTKGVTSDDHRVRIASVRCLIDLHPGPAKTLPALEAAFHGADPEVVNEALSAVAEAGKPALPGIVAALKFKEARGHAAVILGKMGICEPKVVDALVEALSDERSDIRREICFSLGSLGPGAASATPALIKLLQDDSDRVRYSATFALGKLGPGAKAAVPALIEELKGDDAFERSVSAWALAHIVPEDAELARQIMPILCEGLKNEQPIVRGANAEALGKLGKNAAGAAAALTEATKDPVPGVSKAATKALEAIKGG